MTSLAQSMVFRAKEDSPVLICQLATPARLKVSSSESIRGQSL